MNGEYRPAVKAGTIDRATGITVVNTAVETTLFTKDFPANTLTNGMQLSGRWFGSQLNNSAGAAVWVWRLKVNGTAILTSTTGAIAQSANRRGFELDFAGQIDPVQGWSLTHQYSPANASGVMGAPAIAFITATTAVDRTAIVTVALTVQMVADPLIETVLNGGNIRTI